MVFNKISILAYSVFSLASFQAGHLIMAAHSDDPLRGIKITEASNAESYDRHLYDYGIDADGDGKNTRAELLISRSEASVQFRSAKKRTVSHGRWFDPYTGVTFKNANDVDIDHLVPLYEVHISGGADWSARKKRAFANDLSDTGPLRITHRWTNRIPKNADDPTEYSPSWVPGRCAYLQDWINIKREWGLSMDKEEAEAIRKQMRACV